MEGVIKRPGSRQPLYQKNLVPSRGLHARSGKRLSPAPLTSPVAGWAARRGQELPQVAARLPVGALGGGDGANQVGALESDGVVGWTEKQPFDDPVETRVWASVLREVGEEPP